MTFHALWVVCALGAVALAAAPSRAPWTGLFAVSLGFAIGAWWFGSRHVPDVQWVGLTVFAVAATRLVSSRGIIVAAFVAGVLGAVWMSILRFEGLPWWAAMAIAGAPPIVSAYLTSRRPRFAPAIVRDEALLITLMLGVAVAAAPRILEGWRSAVALNMQDNTGRALVVPAWTIALSAGAAAAGGVYSLWRRG